MNNFAKLGINDDLLKGLADLGFTQPTPVQAKVIPLVLERPIDLVSLAQTGTGKTGAFGLPLIQLTDSDSRKTQGLVLCPTRELCMQVARDLEGFARHVEGLRVLAVYGGASIEPQIKALRKGVQIIVATPGRLNDLINRGMIDFSGVHYVVFDEADEMLQMGFQDELNAILAHTPSQKSTLLFSATMSKGVAAIAGKYMTDPVEITIGKRNAGAENVRHDYYMVHAKDRYAALKRIVDNSPDIYSIIFCRTRKETNDVAGKLIQDGYNADALHGDLTQIQRDQVMKKFRAKNLQLLVATDVAARGLDVTDLTHVINYNLPDDTSNYTHRSGRTGRAGQAGISVAIINLKEKFKIREIEKNLNKKFNQGRIPSGMEICRKQLVGLIDEVTRIEVDHERIDPLYAEVAGKLEELSREELIKKFVSWEFRRFLDYYKNAPDLNINGKPQKERPLKERTQKERSLKERLLKKTPVKIERKQAPVKSGADRDRHFTRFFLNVGRRQGILPQALIGKINEIPGAGRIDVGKIDIMRNRTLIEADSRYAPKILAAFQQAQINGKTVTIEIDKAKSPSAPSKPEAPQYRKIRKNKGV